MKSIFVSFAIEDKFARNNLAYQAKQHHTPFNFIDMSIYEPWSSSWKTNCRNRIKQCHGLIAFISNNTYFADGACWEIRCAIEEGIPILPIYIHDFGTNRVPKELGNRWIYKWTWDNVSNFINSL